MASPAENREPFCIVTNQDKFVDWQYFQDYAIKEGEDKTPGRSMSVDPFTEFYDSWALIEPPQNLLQLSGLIDANTFHGRCLRVKVNDTVGLGWHFTPKGEEDKNETGKQEAEEFMQWECYDGQEMIGGLELIKRWWLDIKSNGNGALELIYPGYDESKPLAKVAYLPSHSVRVHKSKDTYCQIVGFKRVWFARPGLDYDVDWRTGSLHPKGSLGVEHKASVLLHTKEPTYQSAYYGLPEYIPAVGAIYSQLSIRNYNLNFFSNYGIPAYAVYITGDVDFGEKVEATGEYKITTAIKDGLATVKDNPHSTMVLTVPTREAEGKAEVKFVPLDTATKDGSFQVLNKSDRDEILTAHGVPSYRVSLTEAGSLGGSVSSEATEIYKDSVLQPDKKKAEFTWNLHIFTEGLELVGWTWTLNELDTSQEDQDIKLVDTLWMRGGITPNQIIKALGGRLGLDPVEGEPGMDWHYINWQPIETGAALRDELAQSVKDFHGQIVELIVKDKKNGPDNLDN